jgi:hypothetical protein
VTTGRPTLPGGRNGSFRGLSSGPKPGAHVLLENSGERGCFALSPDIQWEELATIRGESPIDTLLKKNGADAAVDQMWGAVRRIRGGGSKT